MITQTYHIIGLHLLHKFAFPWYACLYSCKSMLFGYSCDLKNGLPRWVITFNYNIYGYRTVALDTHTLKIDPPAKEAQLWYTECRCNRKPYVVPICCLKVAKAHIQSTTSWNTDLWKASFCCLPNCPVASVFSKQGNEYCSWMSCSKQGFSVLIRFIWVYHFACKRPYYGIGLSILENWNCYLVLDLSRHLTCC